MNLNKKINIYLNLKEALVIGFGNLHQKIHNLHEVPRPDGHVLNDS